MNVLKALGLKKRRHGNPKPVKSDEEFISVLDESFRSRLLSMYRGEPQCGADGQLHPIDNSTRISGSQGRWLYDLCLSVKPAATLEIGLAYGYSTIFFLAAMAKNQRGHHIAIDAFQSAHWKGIGLEHGKALASRQGSNFTFEHIEDLSARVATDLIRADSSFEIVFIDGGHRFDDVIADFYLYAPLTTVGGYMVIDDMWMNSIQTVADYVRTNRTDFIEVPTDEINISVFQKVSEDGRNWNDFKAFTVFDGPEPY